MVNINMVFESRINLSHGMSKSSSLFHNFHAGFNWASTSTSWKCRTKFNHNFCMFLFNFKERKKKLAYIMQQIACHINVISKMIFPFHKIFIIFSDSSTKCKSYPLKDLQIIIRNFKTTIIIGIFISSSFACVDHASNIKTALTIYKPSKICNIKLSSSSEIISVCLRHISVLLDNSIHNDHNIGYKNCRERLSGLTFERKMRQSEPYRNIRRRSRRAFSANSNWSVSYKKLKVTECLNESSRLLAQNLGQTLDEVTRDVLNAMASTLNCSNGVNSLTPTELTKADIDAAVVTLLGQDALMISEVIEASDKFSTSAVRPAFFAYIDTALLDDLENVADFLSASNYSSVQRVLEGEWGSTGNVRWLYTSVGAVSSASPAVYSNFIIGKEAYACIHLGGEQGEFTVHPLGSAGAADPLNQRGSVSWKAPFAARILNDNFCLNLLATHS